MGRRKTRAQASREQGQDEAQAQEQEHEATAENDEPPETSGGAAGKRARSMYQVARRRAAHFAQFNAGDDDGTAPTENARCLGPWASARELGEGLADAKEARQRKLIEGQAEKADVEWVPMSGAGQQPVKRRQLPSLSGLCLKLLAEYADCIVSLAGVPDSVKIQLAGAVSAKRMMTEEAFGLFVAGAPREVVIPDLTLCGEPILKEKLIEASTPLLERLELRMCGRGFGDKVGSALGAAKLTGLKTLVIAGAYRLFDSGVKGMLGSMPQLQKLHLPDCCHLQDCVKEFPVLCPSLQELSLAGCRGISPSALQEGLTGLKSLVDLRLDGVQEVDDDLLKTLCDSLPLTRLRLDFCSKITDAGITHLAQLRGQNLEELSCGDVPKLTDTSIAELAKHCPMLRSAEFRHCHLLTDEAVASLAENGRLTRLSVNSVRGVGRLTMAALAKHCRDSLEDLDISWCRDITDNMLGTLADSCTALTTIRAWGCSQITKKFVDGHSSESLRLLLGCD